MMILLLAIVGLTATAAFLLGRASMMTDEPKLGKRVRAYGRPTVS